MWQGEILAGIAGLCGGAVVAVALAAFIIELGIIPRFAGITHTANHIFLYENCLMLGSFLGNLIYIYHLSVPFGKIFAGVTGFFFGMFLGGWISALVEVVNVFAVMARRLGLKKGIGWIVICIAVGKTLGSLFQFFIA